MLEPAPHPSTQAFAYDERQPVACTTTVVGAVGDPCQMGTSTDMDVEKAFCSIAGRSPKVAWTPSVSGASLAIRRICAEQPLGPIRP